VDVGLGEEHVEGVADVLRHLDGELVVLRRVTLREPLLAGPRRVDQQGYRAAAGELHRLGEKLGAVRRRPWRLIPMEIENGGPWLRRRRRPALSEAGGRVEGFD